MAHNPPQPDPDVVQRDAVMDGWAQIAATDGWDDTTEDVLYWAAVDGIAWSLIEQTADTLGAVRASAETLAAARATAERIVAAREAPAQDALALVERVMVGAQGWPPDASALDLHRQIRSALSRSAVDPRAALARAWDEGFMDAAGQDHPAYPRTRRIANPYGEPAVSATARDAGQPEAQERHGA